MLTKETEFLRIAKLLTDHLGHDATALAEHEASQSRAEGDWEGCATWLKIRDVIELLVRGDVPDRYTVH